MSGGFVVIDNQTLATGKRGVFAGGDVTLGPITVAGAIGMGKTSALAIDAYLRGKKLPSIDRLAISYKNIPLDDYEKVLRNEAASLPLEKRFSDPDAEVNPPLSQEQVLNEIKRCFVCGKYKPEYTGEQHSKMFSIACHNCHNCHNCEVICPTGALNLVYDYLMEKFH
jgi:formate dehydrogenase beta subunit